MITPAQIKEVGDIAARHGIEHIHLTTRQTMELTHVDPSILEPLLDDLAANGTPLGAEREEVVNVTACLGTRNCKFGIIDSVGLAAEIDKKFFGKELPVKVRIAISSCPNGCESERLNEIGITGIQKPIRIPGSAPAAAPASTTAGRRHRGPGRHHRPPPEQCMECGFCIMPCPFHLIRGSPPEYRITVGGHRGRHPKIGRYLIDGEITGGCDHGSWTRSSTGSTGRLHPARSSRSSWMNSSSRVQRDDYKDIEG